MSADAYSPNICCGCQVNLRAFERPNGTTGLRRYFPEGTVQLVVTHHMSKGGQVSHYTRYCAGCARDHLLAEFRRHDEFLKSGRFPSWGRP